MEKRNLYKPDVKKGGVQPKTQEVNSPPVEFKEEEVFTPKKEKVEVVEEPVVDHPIDIDDAKLPEEVARVVEGNDIPLEKPKKTRKKRELTPAMRENLANMNKKSAEVRRKKKEERIAREAEELRIRDEKIRQSNPTAPRPIPTETAISAMERPAPEIQQVSGIKDTYSGVQDYDRLIEGVVGALRQDKYYSQLEKDIRHDERRRAEKDYQGKLREFEEKQHKTHQRDVGIAILGGNGRKSRGHNSTFMRTQALQSKWKR